MVGEEVFGIPGSRPAAGGGDAALGDDVVDVWVVFHLAGPGVEDAGHAELGTEVFAHARYFLERGGAGFEEEAVAEFLAGSEGASQGFGYGEGDQAVGDVGEEFLFLARGQL